MLYQDGAESYAGAIAIYARKHSMAVAILNVATLHVFHHHEYRGRRWRFDVVTSSHASRITTKAFIISGAMLISNFLCISDIRPPWRASRGRRPVRWRNDYIDAVGWLSTTATRTLPHILSSFHAEPSGRGASCFDWYDRPPDDYIIESMLSMYD